MKAFYWIFATIFILSLTTDASFSAFISLNTAEEEITKQSSQNYDFIIVGGGVGGSVAARRLAERQKNSSVLLLEAGPEADRDCYLIPGFQRNNSQNNTITYKYKYRTVLGDYKEIRLGRALGGTGVISDMVFNRGSPYDFDYWANYTKDSSWSYSNLLSIFKTTENYHGDLQTALSQHGKNGPVYLSSMSVKPGSEYWLLAGQSLGLSHIDPSGPQNVSVNEPVFTKRYGMRENIFDSYILRNASLPNLTVQTNAVVKRIIFDANKKATGVEYEQQGKLLTAAASKEVILTSGAVGNVIILWNSGVGPCNLLQHTIKCVSDRPVGSNLQDHVSVKLNFILQDPSGSHCPNFPNINQTLEELRKNGTGPFDSTQGQLGQLFLASSAAISAGFPDYPDLTGMATRPFYDIHTDEKPLDEKTVNIITTNFVGRPKSTGFIRLNPKNSSDLPIINPNYFSDSEGHDLRILVEGIKAMVRMFEETAVYQSFNATLERPSECNSYEYKSDQYWKCVIFSRAVSSGEFAGTCKMGPLNDPTAVVDPKLRVNGVQNLRILDASIQPKIVNTNLIASTLMIAEKGVEDILKGLRGA